MIYRWGKLEIYLLHVFFSYRRLKPFSILTYSQKNTRVKINWSMVFEILKKSKVYENKKGKKEIHLSQNWKNPDMETSCTISVFLS